MITADAQTLEPGGRITVYELDASGFGADQLFFHQHLQTGVIWWQGQEYGAWPIEATGFERTSDQPPSPRLRVSNLDGRIGALCMLFDDMVGARIIRRQTLVKYLDVENFPKLANIVRLSGSPALSPWVQVGGTATATGTLTTDGITFPAPVIVATGTGGGGWHRRVAGLANVAPVSAGETRVVTVYFRFGTSPNSRLHFTNPTVSGLKEAFVHVGPAATWPTINGQTAMGPMEVLEFVDLGNLTRKMVVKVTYANAGNGAPTYGLGPHSGVQGDSVILLGMQVEAGAVATPFRLTTIDPNKDRNPTADPNEHFPDEIWFIERKVSEDFETVEFELTTAIDLNGEQLPGRQIIAGMCGWIIRGGYRGPYCGYTGPAVADADDIPTTDPSRDQCGGRVRSCKLRFGQDKPLPYGGFPAAGLLRT